VKKLTMRARNYLHKYDIVALTPKEYERLKSDWDTKEHYRDMLWKLEESNEQLTDRILQLEAVVKAHERVEEELAHRVVSASSLSKLPSFLRGTYPPQENGRWEECEAGDEGAVQYWPDEPNPNGDSFHRWVPEEISAWEAQ